MLNFLQGEGKFLKIRRERKKFRGKYKKNVLFGKCHKRFKKNYGISIKNMNMIIIQLFKRFFDKFYDSFQINSQKNYQYFLQLPVETQR